MCVYLRERTRAEKNNNWKEINRKEKKRKNGILENGQVIWSVGHKNK